MPYLDSHIRMRVAPQNPLVSIEDELLLLLVIRLWLLRTGTVESVVVHQFQTTKVWIAPQLRWDTTGADVISAVVIFLLPERRRGVEIVVGVSHVGQLAAVDGQGADAIGVVEADVVRIAVHSRVEEVVLAAGGPVLAARPVRVGVAAHGFADAAAGVRGFVIVVGAVRGFIDSLILVVRGYL